VSGQVPCSGAKRRDKVLDEVSTAVHGDAVAVNVERQPRRPLTLKKISGAVRRLLYALVGLLFVMRPF
jgi:hypothetical protein